MRVRYFKEMKQANTTFDFVDIAAWPFQEPLDSQYGDDLGWFKWRYYATGWGYHFGLDIGSQSDNGRELVSPCAGKIVAKVRLHPGYGNYIQILNDGLCPVYANGKITKDRLKLTWLIAHMQDFNKTSNRYGSNEHKVGDRVSRGQVIGHVGNTGHSTEPHTHVECKATYLKLGIIPVWTKNLNPKDMFGGGK